MNKLFCTVEGALAAWLVSALVTRSKWFDCEPWPNNTWRFIVKDESGLPRGIEWQPYKEG